MTFCGYGTEEMEKRQRGKWFSFTQVSGSDTNQLSHLLKLPSLVWVFLYFCVSALRVNNSISYDKVVFRGSHEVM